MVEYKKAKEIVTVCIEFFKIEYKDSDYMDELLDVVENYDGSHSDLILFAKLSNRLTAFIFFSRNFDLSPYLEVLLDAMKEAQHPNK